ncbi:MAG: hypothetical protein Q9166_006298 [cf. Caloplaca sp. 2 TL-2023]
MPDTISDIEPESVFSYAESLPSVSTTADARDIPATAQLVSVFNNDEMIKSLALKIVDIEGDNFFCKLFADLLMLYSKDLLMGAKTDLEMKASAWVEQERNPLAAAFCLAIQERGTEGPKLFGAQNSEGLTNRRMKQLLNDPFPYHTETNDYLDKVKAVLTVWPAFSKFKENLEKTVLIRVGEQEVPKDLAQELPITQEQPSYQNRIQGVWQCVSVTSPRDLKPPTHPSAGMWRDCT